METETKRWLGIAAISMIFFNLPILIVILWKGYIQTGLIIKGIIDLISIFSADKTISKMKGNLKEGSFSVDKNK